jgi:cell shape-determining protein MreD
MRESLPIILIVGAIMDQLSCSPFMLHVTAYFWLYVILRWIMKVLQVGNRFRLPFIVFFGVLIENLIFLSNITLVEPGMRFPGLAVKVFAVQIIWALFTGPLMLIAFEQSHKVWKRWQSGIFVRRSDLMANKSLR